MLRTGESFVKMRWFQVVMLCYARKKNLLTIGILPIGCVCMQYMDPHLPSTKPPFMLASTKHTDPSWVRAGHDFVGSG